MNGTNLTNQFLIAMPSLHDPNFARTVTYICEHTDNGAMGLIINRTADLQLCDILSQLEITEHDAQVGQLPVHFGGPVQSERGFILHSSDRSWESTLHISERISVTASRDILEAMAHNDGPEKCLIALGYAGWASGQLERELSENSWITSPASEHILFEMPEEQRWQAAAGLIGIDLTLLSGQVGHA